VLYLKAAQLLLMQSQAGMVIKNPRALGAAVGRTATGIPRIIPALHRARIRAGDRELLQIWVSLLSLYRVISFPGVLKLSTIVEEGKKIPPQYTTDLMYYFWVDLYFYLVDRGPVPSIVRYVKEKCLDERFPAPSKGSRSLWESRKDPRNFVTSWAAKYLRAKPFMIWKSSSLQKTISGAPVSVVVTAGLLFRRSLTVWRAVTD
jgi:hypothetical protein